ncbi:MAG: hypothetical protein RLZZ236_2035 [Bacteroidota bacterium]|jgi:hypothetical protein
MEHTAKINLKNLIILSSFLVLPLFVFGQYSKTKLGGVFSYKGNSSIKLTEDSSRQLLINDLTTGVYLSSQNTSCRSDIGLYLFKVDSQGKINKKDLEYFGTLVDSTYQSILYNINKTSGKYIKPTKNNRQKEHWYLFEYLSKGYKYGCYDHNFSNELVRLEAQISHFKIMIWSTLDKVKGINKKLTFIDGSSYDEAIRKGLVPPPEVLY